MRLAQINSMPYGFQYLELLYKYGFISRNELQTKLERVYNGYSRKGNKNAK